MDEGLRELVTRARTGDRAAFEALVRLTARFVYADIALRIRDRSLAEDLSQETFLRAWRNIRSLQSSETFLAWLTAVARSAVTDHLRRHLAQKRPRTASLSDSVDLPASDPLPDLAEQSEDLTRLLDAIDGLPDDQRKALSLLYLANADHAAIRQTLALSDGALRGLLSRGLATLRLRLNSSKPLSTRTTTKG